MNLATTILRWVVRLTGLLQLAIGLALWSGNLLQSLQFHMLDGFVFTLAVLAIVVLAAFAPNGAAGARRSNSSWDQHLTSLLNDDKLHHDDQSGRTGAPGQPPSARPA